MVTLGNILSTSDLGGHFYSTSMTPDAALPTISKRLDLNAPKLKHGTWNRSRSQLQGQQGRGHLTQAQHCQAMRPACGLVQGQRERLERHRSQGHDVRDPICLYRAKKVQCEMLVFGQIPFTPLRPCPLSYVGNELLPNVIVRPQRDKEALDSNSARCVGVHLNDLHDPRHDSIRPSARRIKLARSLTGQLSAIHSERRHFNLSSGLNPED